MRSDTPESPPGLLGDTPERDYSSKLSRFNLFAAPELRAAIGSLALQPGMHVLDAGCGTGEALHWLSDSVQPGGRVVGIDLSAAHVAAARTRAPKDAVILQGDLLKGAAEYAPFDAIWCINTVNHLREPDRGIQTLVSLLRPGGRIALGQSNLLPEMYFAWDSRLERLVNEAVRRYYRDRYGITEHDIRAIRGLFGLLRRANLQNVTARTFMIERFSPIGPADEAYIAQTIFRDTWGERLRPYLDAEDYDQLTRLCDPSHPDFALRRPDFHFLQTFTLVSARA